MPTLEMPSKPVNGSYMHMHPLLDTGKAEIHAHVADPRWQLAWRIAGSGSIGRSRLLARFLLFIVDRHICNRADEITEQQIGVLVFDRAEGYDSNEDNIVRSYARNLRRRIDHYYEKEGRDETLLLEIPRGGYAPAFVPRPVVGETPAIKSEATVIDVKPQPFEISPTQETGDVLLGKASLPKILAFFARGRRSFKKKHALEMYGVITAAVCTGIIIGILAVQPVRFFKRITASPAESAFNGLWRQMFSGDHDTFVVPSDDGLVIMQRLVDRPVPLSRYISGAYRPNKDSATEPGASEILKLGTRRYTSVVDLDFVAHLSNLDAVNPVRMVVRYARDLRMDDLRNGNAVLIGSIESNPWIELFEPEMNFRQIVHADPRLPSGLVNSHPRSGERELYGTTEGDRTYGLIVYQPNLSSTGHVLIVGGLNTAGTQAATTFLLTPALIAPTLQRASNKDGRLQPFELLIGAGNFASNASKPQLIAERIRPN